MPIIQSLDRALQILDLFDEYTPSLKITEISKKMSLHKSTLHSLLKTLIKHGYMAQEEESGKYKLGLKLIEKGQLLLQSLDIRTVANKNLSELSKDTGQTAHLVILNGKEGVYLDKVEGEKAAIRYSRLGGRVPLHCSAVGKILAAFQTDEKMHDLLLEYTFAPRTSNTILEKNDFIRELGVVRKRGYAIDNQENEPGVRCVAAPVFDHSGQVAAAISLSTMTSSVDDVELNKYIEKLLKEATAISLLLGFREIS
jgi:IclR family KDG regulon transcriptional repressor